MARVEIANLPEPPPVSLPVAAELAGLPIFKLAGMDPDTPLEIALGLKDGDRLTFGPAGPTIVRRDGVEETILGL